MNLLSYQRAVEAGWSVSSDGTVYDGSGVRQATSFSLGGQLRVRYCRRHMMVARLALAYWYGPEVLIDHKPKFIDGDVTNVSGSNLIPVPRRVTWQRTVAAAI